MMPIRALAEWEFRAAVRSRFVVATGAIFAVLALALTMVGLSTARRLGLSGAGPTATSLVNLGVLVPSLLGLILGAGTFAGAREHGTLAMLGAQPIRRRVLVGGTFGGLVASLCTTIAIGFGIAGLAMSGVAGTDELGPFLALFATTLASGAASIAVGLAISSRAANRSQALVLAVVVWITFAFGIDLALIALAPLMHFGPLGLLTGILLNPLECARVLALMAMRPEGTALGPFGGYLFERFGSVGAPAVLVTALTLWVVVPLWFTARTLTKKDL